MKLPKILTPLLASLLAGWLAAPGAAAAPPKGAVPPVLDRELFFGNPEISGAQLSPDGRFIAFLKPWKDTRNLWVKRTGEPYSAAHLVTAEPKRPLAGFFWSRDSRYLLFVQDKDGDENYNVYRVDPAQAPAPGQPVPAATNLTEAKGARAMIYSAPRADPDVIYVGLNDRDAAWHDLYKVRVSTGERTLLRKNTERIAQWVFDEKGALRLALRTTDKGDTEILRVDPEGFTKVYSSNVFETAAPLRFHKDGRRVYLETNVGSRDLTELVLFDPENRTETFVEKDPLGRVDLDRALFSEVTGELQATTYVDDRTRYSFKDKALEADFRFLRSRLPGREVALASSTADEGQFLVQAYSDKDPGSVYFFDRKTRRLTLEYQGRERLPRQDMAAMTALRYPSRDGLEIPAYLTLPKGLPAKGLPLVVFPHGGPWARDVWGFNGYAQFLANRGYAVLNMNFRGSTGYGKKFLNAGNLQWGDLMQDDITWGVKYLAGKGIVDPRRVAIMGGSYGGYATLAGVAFTPDVYAAAVDIVGPSNLLTLLETIPPYWEAGRILFYKRMGDPGTSEGRKQLERQSPLFSAGRIRTPLMVVQGANDPRVKRAESEQIVAALRDRHFPVAYLCAPDEGHGFHRPVNNMAMMAAVEKFLADHLKGRFQEGGTPEVLARLGEITVDPATVKAAPKADLSATPLPRPVADLAPGSSAYQGTLAVQGQTLPVSATTVIKEEDGAWTVEEHVKLPMGEASDKGVLEKGTLVLRSRNIQQGPVAVRLAFKDGKASGGVAMMGGAEKPVAVDLGGEIFGDGPGGNDALARLPLAEGYQADLRVFNVEKQKVAFKRLKVAGLEDVTVHAGSARAWKAVIESAEGEPGSTTLWIAQDDRRVLKASTTIPQMAGAVLTLELQ